MSIATHHRRSLGLFLGTTGIATGIRVLYLHDIASRGQEPKPEPPIMLGYDLNREAGRLVFTAGGKNYQFPQDRLHIPGGDDVDAIRKAMTRHPATAPIAERMPYGIKRTDDGGGNDPVISWSKSHREVSEIYARTEAAINDAWDPNSAQRRIVAGQDLDKEEKLTVVLTSSARGATGHAATFFHGMVVKDILIRRNIPHVIKCCVSLPDCGNDPKGAMNALIFCRGLNRTCEPNRELRLATWLRDFVVPSPLFDTIYLNSDTSQAWLGDHGAECMALATLVHHLASSPHQLDEVFVNALKEANNHASLPTPRVWAGFGACFIGLDVQRTRRQLDDIGRVWFCDGIL